MEFYSAIKNNESMSSLRKWLGLEITLYQWQTQTNTVSSPICEERGLTGIKS